MRDHSASAEPSAVDRGGDFPLPGADIVAKAWPDRPPEDLVIPDHPEKTAAVSAAMLVLGAALLLFVPIAGALLIVAGGFGLAISWEGAAAGSAALPITATLPTARQPPNASSIDH